MSLVRGDIVYLAVKGPYTGKPRPAVIVQSTETIAYRDSITVCPLSGMLIDAPLFRVRVPANAHNGLAKTSDIMVDKIVTVPKAALDGEAIGGLTDSQLERLDRALTYWLSL